MSTKLSPTQEMVFRVCILAPIVALLAVGNYVSWWVVLGLWVVAGLLFMFHDSPIQKNWRPLRMFVELIYYAAYGPIIFLFESVRKLPYFSKP